MGAEYLPANGYSEIEESQHLRAHIADKEVAYDSGSDRGIRSLADTHEAAEETKHEEILKQRDKMY